MKIPFVGPSYVLKTRKADVQRSINLMPTAIESGTGKTGMYLEPVPGLRPFPGMPVLPDEPGFPGAPGWPPGPLPVPGPGFTGKLFARWGSSSENGTVFFGAQPAVAKADFLSQLSGYTVYDFEAVDCDGSPPAVQPPFVMDGITVTVDAGSLWCFDPSATFAFFRFYNGRFNTSLPPIQHNGQWLEKFISLSFSVPIYALGFNLTDSGDFGEYAEFHLTTADGYTHVMQTGFSAGVDQCLAFYGFIAQNIGITNIKVFNNTTFFGANDVIGFDDLIIARNNQISWQAGHVGNWFPNFSTPDSDPTWKLNSSWSVSMNFATVTSSNQFNTNSPATLYTATDSVADSVASGTLINTGKFNKAYRIVNGSRVTVASVSNVMRTIGNYYGLRRFSLGFYIRRTGNSVGAGHLFSFGTTIAGAIDGANKLTISFDICSPAFVITSDIALPLNTWVYVLVVYGQGAPQFSGAPIINCFSVYIDGVSQVSFTDDGFTVILEDPPYLATSGVPMTNYTGNVLFGGASSGNYANCDLCEVRFGPNVSAYRDTGLLTDAGAQPMAFTLGYM